MTFKTREGGYYKYDIKYVNILGENIIDADFIFEHGFITSVIDFYERKQIFMNHRCHYDQKYNFSNRSVLIFFKTLSVNDPHIDNRFNTYRDLKIVINFNKKGWLKFLKLLKKNKKCCIDYRSKGWVHREFMFP
jgi:hypothetical protein